MRGEAGLPRRVTPVGGDLGVGGLSPESRKLRKFPAITLNPSEPRARRDLLPATSSQWPLPPLPTGEITTLAPQGRRGLLVFIGLWRVYFKEKSGIWNLVPVG